MSRVASTDMRVRIGMLTVSTLLVPLACAPGANSLSAAATDVAESSTGGTGELGDSLVEGRVTELSGEPVVDVFVTVSDEYCVPDRSAADGSFRVERARDGNKRLIFYGETASTGIVASLVLPIVVEGDTTLGETVMLPRLDEVHALDTESAQVQTIVSSEGLELDIEPGSLTLAPFFAPELRVARVPVADAPAFVPEGVELHDLFALHPIRSTLDPPAALRLPPDPSLSPGASVTFYALDYDTGRLTAVAEGSVDDTGVARTDAGQGIPELTWVGVAIGD